MLILSTVTKIKVRVEKSSEKKSIVYFFVVAVKDMKIIFSV